VTPASIGIKTDDYTKYVALGTNLYAADDHQGALAAFRAALRIKPISAHAPEWLGVVSNAQGHRDRLCKIDEGPWVGNRSKPRDT
jgi:Flp pilus assembly protein TadD